MLRYAIVTHHYERFVGFDLWLHNLNLLATGEVPPLTESSVWTSSNIMWRGNGEGCACALLPFPHRHTGRLSEATA